MKTKIFNRMLRVSYGKIKIGLRTSMFTLVMMSMLMSSIGVGTSQVSAAPVGQGFNLNAADLRFIMAQIKIAETHTAAPGYACDALLGPGPLQVPSPVLPYGLRTVDGSCNNLQPGQSEFGAADNVFPRMLTPTYRQGENWAIDPDGPGPIQVGDPTSYEQKTGLVNDSQPRTVSNLIVDQSPANPAAVAAAGLGAVPDASGTLFIPNVAPDVGLSAPYNSVFTLFGQFFDHGLDLVTKGGSGTVFTPLQEDDPLYIPGSPTNFMVLTRATNLPGPDNILGTADDIQEGMNTTTSFVDQNQTYTSHPSHQVFLRAYEFNLAGDPVPTGKLIDGAIAGNIGNWAEVKAQAAVMLGIELVDMDVLNVPLLATDPYGHFIPGTNGFPQVVFPGNVLVEGNPGAPISVAGSVRTGHAFLDDIAHNAAPKAGLTPDADSAISTAGSPQPVGTYDDELLNVHFITGDGRGNENIGLTAIHTIFHAEHNRLASELGDPGGLIDTLLTPAEIADWHSDNPASGWGYGERLFQAARFVTEMEYQHLVFEEFARKVQPQVNVFSGYHTEIDSSIQAEFAHTVYRFGHSMLTETVARTYPNGVNDDISLFDAFLNPVEFNDGGLDAAQATGNIIRGMSRQVGNELDEFVTDALRNRLVGLPLDLASINMARARSEGIPSLNSARRQFFNATGNSALAPYESWADFMLNLKHSETLLNFIAAYGTHPTITTLDPDGAGPIVAGSLEARRIAAQQILDGPLPGLDGIRGDDPLTIGIDEGADDIGPDDAVDFMLSTGTWANVGGVTITGVDDVDFWVGGLAEKQAPFGGLLGTTFNHVFETQLENLQDGDRFYYLTRTVGLNLLVQLEGNSFAELVMRNSDVEGLPADIFSRPDFVFHLANLGTSGPIPDDATTPDWDEAILLTRNIPTLGTIRFNGAEHVVFNGADNLSDLMWSSEGDDTLRGNGGNDRIEGAAGNDQFIGGLGNDILTDNFGDDVLKGGDGNDAMGSGQGFDLNQGGRGDDFVVGGSDPTETFGGPGDDFIFAGDSADTVFGDDGDDWIEGGNQADLLQGDNGFPFQNDPNGGHDVIIGGGGNDDFDSEGGDDVLVSGPGIERNEGMLGFDWVTHRGDPQAADADLTLIGLLPPDVNDLRDRFDLVEGLSGWNFNDTLRGDNGDAAIMIGHELDAAGIARINGLANVLPAGATSFTGGNIILGGSGSDLIEGRGGDDIIDGDRWLNVQLNHGTQFVDSMLSLRTAVFAGTIDPGNINIVRSIISNPGPSDVDTALFTGAVADYTITANPNGSVTVTDNVGLDGTDTLWNIELLAFTDGTFAAPVNSCRTLALGHTGSGSDPIASPTNSVGCAVGTYLLGESISLSGVVPAAGFQIGSWTGTNNDASTAATNTVTMPATNHSVTVNYVDAAPAVASSTLLNAATNNRTTVFFSVTFSESVTGVNAADFSLTTTGAISGATVTSVTGTGSIRTVGVNTGTGNGTIRLNVTDDNSIRDSANNPLGGAGIQNFTTGQTYTIDKTTPSVASSVRANANPTNRTTAFFTVTFSETVTGVDTADFTLTNTGVSGAAITSVTGTGATRTVGVNTGTGDGTIRLDVVDNDSIMDAAGNRLGGTGAGNGAFTTGQSYNVDKTAPTVVSSTRLNPNPTTRVTVFFSVTFSESVTGVTAADFSLTAPGITGASVTSVTGTGATRTVGVNTGTGSGTITLNVLDDDSIMDAATNRLGGTGAGNGSFNTGQTYNVR